MSRVYILIEQAIGYGLLKIKHCKSIENLLEILKERDVEILKSKVKLVEFKYFTSPQNATDNCVGIANGVATKDLKKFLKKHLSEESGILVVMDKKLAENLTNIKLLPSITYSSESNVVFGLRTIRFNFHEFINYDRKHLEAAHIGLGHGYSRVKIKYNENRSDNMIIQTIHLLDHQDKVINKLCMRLREWFGYHFPELFKIVPDNKMYCNVVSLIKSREGATDDLEEKLAEIVKDSSKVQQIIEMAGISVGFELMKADFKTIGSLVKETLNMISMREETAQFLSNKMAYVAPNFTALVGDIVGARLIAHAGSLINLAKSSASTIQILGAEKALFRALKTRGNTPKYGLLFHSHFVSRAPKGDKGRISRFLAAKIALAVRLDCFSDEPISIYGQCFKKQMEERLSYLETGDEPRKNFEVMEEAVAMANAYIVKMKEDNEKNSEDVQGAGACDESANLESSPKKKSKKIKKEETISEIEQVEENSEKQKTKKKKRKSGKQEETANKDVEKKKKKSL